MACDHLVCHALGTTCELTYGTGMEGALDKHDDAPPDERIKAFERDLAAVDLDALRALIRGERARRAVRLLFDDVVLHEKYDLSLTHDADQRAEREALLVGRLKAIKVE